MRLKAERECGDGGARAPLLQPSRVQNIQGAQAFDKFQNIPLFDMMHTASKFDSSWTYDRLLVAAMCTGTSPKPHKHQGNAREWICLNYWMK